MNKPHTCRAVTGLILGFIPAAVVVFLVLGLSDATWGHSGGEVLHLLALLVLGIPGMTFGCFLGAVWQRGSRKRAMHVILPLGALIGTGVGFIAGLFLLGDPVSSIFGPFRGGTIAASAGMVAGGIAGTLLAGLLVSRRAQGEEPVSKN